MNQCHFLGNLTADPELKTLNGDKKVLSFRIAVNRRFKRANGEPAQEAAFLDCEAWDSGAQLIADHFLKGDPIIIHASVKQEEWTDKESGQKRTKLKFRVNQFEFVPRRERDAEPREDAPPAKTRSKAKPKSKQVETANEDDDQIPF